MAVTLPSDAVGEVRLTLQIPRADGKAENAQGYAFLRPLLPLGTRYRASNVEVQVAARTRVDFDSQGRIRDPLISDAWPKVLASDAPGATIEGLQWVLEFHISNVEQQPTDVIFTVPARGFTNVGLIVDPYLPSGVQQVLVAEGPIIGAIQDIEERAAEVLSVVATTDGLMAAAFRDPNGEARGEMTPIIAAALVSDSDTRAELVQEVGALTVGELGLVRKTDPGIPFAAAYTEYLDVDLDSEGHLLRGIRQDGQSYLPMVITDRQRVGDNGPIVVQSPASDGVVSRTVDAAGRVLEDELGLDGRAPNWVIRAQGERRRLLNPYFVARGDSITAGALGGGTTYPLVLSTLLNAPVYTRAYPGESSTTIARRQGALPILVTVTSGSIPAAGSVAVTLNIAIATGAWTAQGLPDGSKLDGYLAGVRGVIAGSPGNYTFTRAQGGDTAVPVPTTVPWLDEWEVTHRDGAQLLCIGRNNFTDTPGIIDDIRRSIAANFGPTLVIGVLTRTNEQSGSSAHTAITTLNAALAQIYGQRFLDIRAFLITSGLASAGITPTSDDTAAIAADTIPPSLTADGLHLNAAGYTVFAKAVRDRLVSIGWIK